MTIKLIAILILMFAIILPTALLWYATGARFGADTSKMGRMPAISSLVLLVLGISLIYFNPHKHDLSKSSLIYSCLLYGMTLVIQLLFFLKLNNCHKDYSLSSFIGIFGTMCGIGGLATLFLAIITGNEPLGCHLFFTCEIFHTIIIGCAIGVLCGSLYDRHKIIRNMGLMLLAVYIFCNFLVAYGSLHELGLYSGKELYGVIYNIHIAFPVIGWSIFLMSFMFDKTNEAQNFKSNR